MLGSSISLNATSITVGPLGSINATGLGWVSGQGYGAGQNTATGGGGGGHAGTGGDGQGGTGGGPYGGVEVWLKGSGGGSSQYGIGGAGGGRVQLLASRVSNMGSIVADGESGGHAPGGGGAGGSVMINASYYSGGRWPIKSSSIWSFKSEQQFHPMPLFAGGLVSANGGDGKEVFTTPLRKMKVQCKDDASPLYSQVVILADG